jgi:hypothetical protein
VRRFVHDKHNWRGLTHYRALAQMLDSLVQKGRQRRFVTRGHAFGNHYKKTRSRLAQVVEINLPRLCSSSMSWAETARAASMVKGLITTKAALSGFANFAKALRFAINHVKRVNTYDK